MSDAAAPRRIASLLASATEMLYGLGLGDRLVAVSHECDFPPEAATKPRVTRSNIAASADSLAIDRQVRALLAAGQPLYEIDTPRLAALRPELIVTQAQCDVCAVRYEDVVATVQAHQELRGCPIVPLNPLSLADVLADVERVGRAAAHATEGRRYAARLRARVDAVAQRTAHLAAGERPRVACIEWIEPLMAAGNWMPEIVHLAGGRQTLATAGRHSTVTPWEAVRAFDPECVVVMPCGFDLRQAIAAAEVLTRLPGWRELSAVQSGRVFAVDGSAYFNRSGPRLVDSLELLAGLAQPALFGGDKWGAAETSRFARLPCAG